MLLERADELRALDTVLEAANYAARDVEIRPVAIDYGAAIEDDAPPGKRGA